MITQKRYLELKRRIQLFDAWVDTIRNPRNGAASYYPSQVPKDLIKVTNKQRSAVQAYEFVHNPPDKYVVYVKRYEISPGIADARRVTATTWTGQTLGHGRLGPMYKCPSFGGVSSIRYPIRFKGINGRVYSGVYYSSTGDFARVKAVKTKKH